MVNITVYPVGTPFLNQAEHTFRQLQFGFNLTGSAGFNYTIQAPAPIWFPQPTGPPLRSSPTFQAIRNSLKIIKPQTGSDFTAPEWDHNNPPSPASALNFHGQAGELPHPTPMPPSKKPVWKFRGVLFFEQGKLDGEWCAIIGRDEENTLHGSSTEELLLSMQLFARKPFRRR